MKKYSYILQIRQIKPVQENWRDYGKYTSLEQAEHFVGVLRTQRYHFEQCRFKILIRTIEEKVMKEYKEEIE